jgi:hypothetical protein
VEFFKSAADPANAVLTAMQVLYAAAAIYVAARFRLSNAATVAEGRIIVTSSWDLTRGSVLPLMLAILFVSSPTYAWSVGRMFWVFDIPRIAAATGVTFKESFLNSLSEVAIGSILQPALSAGFFAYAYRAVTNPGTVQLNSATTPELAPAPVA